MFKEMRRKDKAMPEAEIRRILEKAEFGVLSTLGENGYPYPTPLSFVYYKEKLYFHSAAEGGKIDNIKNCGNVSFCIVDSTEVLADKFDMNYRSVIVFGMAQEVTDAEKEDVLIALIEKYSNEFLHKGITYVKNAQHKTRVFSISPEHITGKQQW